MTNSKFCTVESATIITLHCWTKQSFQSGSHTADNLSFYIKNIMDFFFMFFFQVINQFSWIFCKLIRILTHDYSCDFFWIVFIKWNCYSILNSQNSGVLFWSKRWGGWRKCPRRPVVIEQFDRNILKQNLLIWVIKLINNRKTCISFIPCVLV